MIPIHLYCILFFLFPFVISVEEYTTYHTSSKYPRPLLLSTEVLALSGNPGAITVLNSNGEVTQKQNALNFNYEGNACVRACCNYILIYNIVIRVCKLDIMS